MFESIASRVDKVLFFCETRNKRPDKALSVTCVYMIQGTYYQIVKYICLH